MKDFSNLSTDFFYFAESENYYSHNFPSSKRKEECVRQIEIIIRSLEELKVNITKGDINSYDLLTSIYRALEVRHLLQTPRLREKYEFNNNLLLDLLERFNGRN